MSILSPVMKLVSQAMLSSSIKQIRPTNHLRSLVNLGATQSRRMFGNKDTTGQESFKKIRTDMLEKLELDEMFDTDNDAEFKGFASTRVFADLKLENYESLYKDDKSGTIKAKIEEALSEYEYLKYNNQGKVPLDISVSAMARLLKENLTAATREKYFRYLFMKEALKYRQNLKKKEHRAKTLQQKRDQFVESIMRGDERSGLLSKDNELTYGLWHNNMFCRIPDNKLTGQNSSKLIQAALYGNKIIYDFSFDKFMLPWISRNVVEQLRHAMALNSRDYEEQFDLWICNLDANSECGKIMLQEPVKTQLTKSMVTIKEDCFMNYFDKSRLIYLSPNAKLKLSSVGKEDDIYIIGAYNDRGNTIPLSYKKALDLGIRARSLPIDSFLAWGAGSKNLCINHVTGILLDYLANGGSWREALNKHIPSRKIKPTEIVIKEEQSKQRRLIRHRSLRPELSIREQTLSD